MRAVRTVEEFIPIEEVSKALGVTIDKMTLGQSEDTIKAHVGKAAIIYLRCSDLKNLFKLKVNLLDADTLKVNKKGISYFKEEEIFKGTPEKWIKNTKKLAKKISQSFY